LRFHLASFGPERVERVLLAVQILLDHLLGSRSVVAVPGESSRSWSRRRISALFSELIDTTRLTRNPPMMATMAAAHWAVVE